MSPLRARMIEDMILAGLSKGTQREYLRAVWQLAKHYRRAPDQLSEDEVRCYLLALRQCGWRRRPADRRRLDPLGGNGAWPGRATGRG